MYILVTSSWMDFCHCFPVGAFCSSSIKIACCKEPTVIKMSVVHATTSLLSFTDVKPSNILINKRGEIKLCDFGIAGELVNSYVGTNIGCKPYLAPERINPIRMDDPYDQRSDVWSYGITIVSFRPMHTH